MILIRLTMSIPHPALDHGLQLWQQHLGHIPIGFCALKLSNRLANNYRGVVWNFNEVDVGNDLPRASTMRTMLLHFHFEHPPVEDSIAVFDRSNDHFLSSKVVHFTVALKPAALKHSVAVLVEILVFIDIFVLLGVSSER